MNLTEIMTFLEINGSEKTKKVLMRHGAREPFFGVKIEFLKEIQKKVKKDHNLSIELYNTGNSDAMYLAGLIADEKQISKAELNKWVENAYWHMLSEFSVAWIAAESRFGIELALEWIESTNEQTASAGWATLSNLAAIKQDSELDIQLYSLLLDRVEREIHQSTNRVRHTMNGFVIATGCSITSLKEKAISVADKMGKISVNMGDTACKVPQARDYIEKAVKTGKIGKKRKTCRC